MKLIYEWFYRYFSDPQAILLVILLSSGITVVMLVGNILAPVLASIVIAYLLDGLVKRLQLLYLPRGFAVILVLLAFMASLAFVIVELLPLLSKQSIQLIQQLPIMIDKGYSLLEALPEQYPQFVTEAQILELTSTLRTEITRFTQSVLSWSLASVVGLITLMIYLILVPLLVLFFLKDKDQILNWVRGFLPPDITATERVWQQIDIQMGNYVRGKFWEIIIVWSACFVAFTYLGLQFAMLLGLMVGLSVIIPYIGSVVVTIPVALVAFFQWGWSSEFVWVMTIYLIIQVLDGNVLVPLLFSEVVNLHPIAIIVAVLFFGGIWGFWGVFFAIPLATVVQVLLTTWPYRIDQDFSAPLPALSESDDN